MSQNSEFLEFLSNTSTIPAPNGVPPNFVDPESRAGVQVITTSVVLAIMLLFVINRAYTKVVLLSKVTWDDITITFALLGSIAYYVSCTWGAQRGKIGRHEWNVSLLQAMSSDLLIPCWLISVLTPLTFLFLKSTFFILYLQLFKTIHWLCICSWIGLAFTALSYTIFTILVFTFSTPRKGQSWLDSQTSKLEHNTLAMSVPQSTIGLGIDLYILLIPIIGVTTLQMSKKKKFGVILIFLSGLMACVCSAVSIYYRAILERSQDTTWALIPVNTATLCEMYAGIICACMPSAAAASRQSGSIYQRLLSTFSTRLGSLKSTWLASKHTSNSRDLSQGHRTESHPPPEVLTAGDVMKSTDQKYAKYFNLVDLSSRKSVSEENITPGFEGMNAV